MSNPKKIKKQYVFEIEATEYLHELILKQFTAYKEIYGQLFIRTKKGMKSINLEVNG